jgi:hypothetical protein
MKKPTKVVLWTGVAAFFAVMGLVVYADLHPGTVALDSRGRISKTAFYVKNVERVDWVECIATLNRKFSTEQFALHAGDELRIEFPQFSAADGERFNFVRYAPRSIHLVCGPFGDRRSIDFERIQ